MTEESTSPRLISTGELNNIQELYLASEAMVVRRFNPPSILNAVATLLGSFYSFDMEFPKGSQVRARKKCVSVFRAHAPRSNKCNSAIVCGKCFV